MGPGSELVLLGDPGRVRQILTNLLTNSIKFTSEGSVCLSTKIVRETDDTVEVSFSVVDTGIGIEEEVIKKGLFTPFGQADSSTARRFGGTGLGLTICQNLVELMHGTIGLESTLGAGTTATFTIPFSKPSFHDSAQGTVELSSLPDRLQSELSISCRSNTPPLSRSPPDRAHSNAGSDKRGVHRTHSGQSVETVDTIERENCHILVVEDNAINQKIALKTIRKLNFSVSAVWNGQEALEYLSKEPTEEHPRPDIILMDVQMPILDGVKTTQVIRHNDAFKSDPYLKSVPIIAMTASAIQGDREKCERAGMDDYLAKPVKRGTLETMLVKWLYNNKGPKHRRKYLPSHSSDSELSPAELQRLLPAPANQRTTKLKTENDEQALWLRDEKLIAGGDLTATKRLTPSEREEGTSYFSLTEENMEKFKGSMQRTVKEEPSDSSMRNHHGNGSTPLLVQGGSGGDSEVGDLPALREIKAHRAQLPRNDSEWSEKTVRP